MQAPRCTPNSTYLCYTLVRHLGFILDELSSQGLEVWLDEAKRWHWRWIGSDCQSLCGFWALGEALVDAVTSRFPETFVPDDASEAIEHEG